MEPNGGATLGYVDLLPDDAVEGGYIHFVHVDSSIQVIHLVLCYPRIPTLENHLGGGAQLADAPDPNLVVPLHLAGIAPHAHAALGMFVYLAADYLQLGINEDLQE